MRTLVLVSLMGCAAGSPGKKPDDGPPPDDTSVPADGDGDGVAATDDCDDADPAVGAAAAWYADADADGYGDAANETRACDAPPGTVTDTTDCDDAAPAVSPAAPEVCDDIDNDCDHAVDEGLTATFHADADGDGRGDANTPIVACTMPVDAVEDDTDCDDTRAEVFPGNPEVCDGLDNDCDGEVDEGVTTRFYVDADGDGWGDPSIHEQACVASTGYAEIARDCDDADAAVFPDAVEVCNGVDDDCEGSIDDAAIDAPAWYLDADGDGYGGAPDKITCVQPAGSVSDGSDCDDADATIFPEADGTCPDGADCADILARGASGGDGTYIIDPDGSGVGAAPFDVLCEMDIEGGGWTQALEAFLAPLSTADSRRYLYTSGAAWYLSPATNLVWDWSSYQPLDGDYSYASSGTAAAGTFACTHAEAGGWGVGCSGGVGATYKVLPIYASDASIATSTICQDLPDVFGAGACRSDVSIWVR